MATKKKNPLAKSAVAASLFVALTGLLAFPPMAVHAQTPNGTQQEKSEADAPVVRLPAHLAYTLPGRDREPNENGAISLNDAKQSLVWYVKLTRGGELRPAVTVRLPKNEQATLGFTVAQGGAESGGKSIESLSVTVVGAGMDSPVSANLPIVSLGAAQTGWLRFTLSGLQKQKTSKTFGDVESLTLTGSALTGAFFNTTRYRSTASVHLGYPLPASLGPVDAFYNEVTTRRDPVVTYYCAIGWSRGYMGYQVNGPNERRIIFSVWDAGNEKNDQNAVAQKDRAEWLASGPGVVTDRFGNEGTGGHSHLVYPWKNNQTYRFLVTSQTDGPDHLVYAGYFFFPEKNAWGLIGKIRTPAKTPGSSASEAALHGLYSFDEDFSGAAGDKLRLAEFGPQWAHTSGGWQEIVSARFTNTDRTRKQRDDYDAFPTRDGRAFALSTGGYVSPFPPTLYGDVLARKKSVAPPADLNDVLSHLPMGVPLAPAKDDK